MNPGDIQLLAIALASVLILVALIVSRIRMHPLLALLPVSYTHLTLPTKA